MNKKGFAISILLGILKTRNTVNGNLREEIVYDLNQMEYPPN